jgi:hypothetical protein
VIWKIGTGAAVIGLVAGVTALSLWVLGVDFGGGTSAQQDEVRGTGTLLRTSNRDTLAACVELVGVDPGSPEAQLAVENIREAVAMSAAHPYWSQTADLDIAMTAYVDVGCPSGIPPTTDLPSSVPIGGIFGHLVEVPSTYLLFVFVMPDKDAMDFTGGLSARGTTQEYTCEGDDCVETTLGLYIGLSEALENGLNDTISDAVGLR